VTVDQLSSPFGSEPIKEIHLARAPLVKVLTQIRFPSLSKLRDEETVTRLTSVFSDDYPLVQDQRAINLVITPTGVSQQQAGQRIWVLRSSSEEWKVSISENFLALETIRYNYRQEFIDRFNSAIQILMEEVHPPYFERLGMRYINRISDQNIIGGRLNRMIRSEMLGGLATLRPDNVDLRHSLSDSLFIDGERSIQVRCGILPPNAIVDTDVAPVEEPIWILDIDSFREQRMTGAANEMSQELEALTDRAYRMFRWVVTTEFIDYFRLQT
jgi:uncharacterized protein (TIGR04255 family)